ncbi:hypothetical protein CDL15_Pgr019515 [Punica granatum]|uniref:Uncharacterized protein n=1 Tax=Punica granatum TaxID=22663 RepID=A0A218Y0C6_PUNGR|nr:hypothetical protein CDL15_Pgr019515 [Punica granatum]
MNTNIMFNEICDTTLAYSAPNPEICLEKLPTSREEKSMVSVRPRASQPPCKEGGRELPLIPPTREDLSPLDLECFSPYYRILVTVKGITTIEMA